MTIVKAALIQAKANLPKQEAIDKHIKMLDEAVARGAHLVRGQALRGLQFRACGEIGRRANDRHAKVGADAYCNRVLCNLLAESNTGGVALPRQCRLGHSQ